ncbi:NAD(P)/FAD-dependent oxidoreductase [Limnobacter sp.]|uniref:NAD(P)/FAD-dependent oxidoreductase n=1 Tax=Limnobacter sp. TaxID=2003368 RepID=UPI003516936C
MKKRIAVIGAGVAGLACARELVRMGHEVLVFEKSRGPGGRMPTRWLDREVNPPLGFDHGTQYFQASAPAFLTLMEQAQAAHAVALWEGRVVDLGYGVSRPHAPGAKRWVGTPGMASLARFMAQGLNVRLQSRVAAVQKQGSVYQLTIHLADGSVRVDSGFDAVVCAIPAEQVVQLFEQSHSDLAGLAQGVQSTVTWAVMLTPREPLKVDYDGAFVVDSPLGWICRDSSKPGRAAGDRWLLQATADWSMQHKDDAPEEVLALLLDVFSNVTGQIIEPMHVAAHRWLYSLPVNPLGLGHYLDENALLGACGDWLGAARVEDAFLSGHALGERLNLVFDAALAH